MLVSLIALIFKITNHTSFCPHYGNGIPHLQGPFGPVVTPLSSAVTGSGRAQATWTLQNVALVYLVHNILLVRMGEPGGAGEW